MRISIVSIRSVFTLVTLAVSLATVVFTIEGYGAENSSLKNLKGFSGPEVPQLTTILGDYCNTGVRTHENRTDIPLLMQTLKQIKAKDYMHLVWRESAYPHAWDDFQAMAPEFQKANINLWLYITPPVEGGSAPFGEDYVQWAVECAKIAKKYPMVKGIVIDDFNASVDTFTPEYCKTMMTEAHKIAPKLSLLAVCYYKGIGSITKHVERGVIDGVIFPFYSNPLNHHDTSQLPTQIATFNAALQKISKKLKTNKTMPLVVMVYASKLSSSPDSPTPSYVKDGIDIALSATRNGQANGVVTYCLPKDKPEFLLPVAKAYLGL